MANRGGQCLLSVFLINGWFGSKQALASQASVSMTVSLLLNTASSASKMTTVFNFIAGNATKIAVLLSCREAGSSFYQEAGKLEPQGAGIKLSKVKLVSWESFFT